MINTKSIQKKFETFDATTRVVINLIETLDIKVTKFTISETLQNQPTYPSLLSISDSFERWNIDASSYEIPKEVLFDLEMPLISYKGGQFIVIHSAVPDRIVYFNGLNIVAESAEQFFINWNAVVLIPCKYDFSGEKNYRQELRKETIRKLIMPAIFISVAVIVLIKLYVNLHFNIIGIPEAAYFGVLLMIKWVGIAIAVLLLWYEIDKKNGFIQKICSSIANSNCGAILGSKEAKLFNLVSWSEIGFFYFSFGFLGLLFFPGFVWLIVLLNVLSLPYILFSIYYQWRVAKQWCILCLGVQVLLLSEFVVAYLSGDLTLLSSINWYSQLHLIPDVLLLAALPVGLWYLVKPLFKGKVLLKNIKRDLNKFKFNEEIFDSFLKKQKSIDIPNFGVGLTFGEPNSKYNIVKVCNPYCAPCSKSHPELEKLIRECNDLEVQILFTATNAENDFQSPVVKHFLAIAELSPGSELTLKALDTWYNADVKDYSKFSELYPIPDHLVAEQKDKIQLMSDWCDKTGIEFTPTFFFNGHQLPQQYSISDLAYFINA